MTDLRFDPTRARVMHPAFWSNPDAADWNVGGDRLWFGPERDWFWSGSADDLSNHLVPAEIDPGTWKQVAPGEVQATVRLRDRTTNAVTEIDVTRRIDILDDSADRIEYRTTNTVRIVSGPPGQTVSAWNVLQVPLGGTLTVDLAAPLSYRDILDPVDPARLTVRGGQAVLRATGARMFKVGLSASVFGGWLSYTRDDIVIERTVPVHRDLHYCDGPGDVLQIFEDDGHYGGYTEIEHHSPAAIAGQIESVVDEYRTVLRPNHR
ncbi:MAG TPA: hypothetical protein VG247_33940 [Pseudonocardiaceae bacterium]|nr:hypothetical protein [Pseudonocardiaceae bacterium]